MDILDIVCSKDPGTQAPKTSNFVDGATSPTTNERGVVRVHKRRGYLQRSSLWCEVEVKRNGEGESVTLMMVAHMMCRAKERSEREGAGFERDRAPWMWGFPHHQSPHAGWYPTRRVGYLYSASQRSKKAIAAEQDSNTTVSHRTGVEPGSLS